MFLCWQRTKVLTQKYRFVHKTASLDLRCFVGEESSISYNFLMNTYNFSLCVGWWMCPHSVPLLVWEPIWVWDIHTYLFSLNEDNWGPLNWSSFLQKNWLKFDWAAVSLHSGLVRWHNINEGPHKCGSINMCVWVCVGEMMGDGEVLCSIGGQMEHKEHQTSPTVVLAHMHAHTLILF